MTFERFLMGLSGWDDLSECQEVSTQDGRHPAQEKAEVVAGGGEDGVVDAVTVRSFEIIAAHSVLDLEMADDRLDGSSAPHLVKDGGGDAADLAGDPNPELVGMAVAAVALVHVNAAGLDLSEPFEIGDNRHQRVSYSIPLVQNIGQVSQTLAVTTISIKSSPSNVAPKQARKGGLERSTQLSQAELNSGLLLMSLM